MQHSAFTCSVQFFTRPSLEFLRDIIPHSAFASLVACQMENYHFADPAITTSPSEDEEDNAEFYDAQESDTFTLTVPIATSNSISHARDRTDSQGSDDGSSSEGDPTPLPVSDSTGTDSFLIVTDSTAAQTLSAVRITNDLDIVSKLHSFSSFFLSSKMIRNIGCRYVFFYSITLYNIGKLAIQ